MRDITEAPPRACAANFCVSTTPKREATWVYVEHSQHGVERLDISGAFERRRE
jgi:hypothetical protein